MITITNFETERMYRLQRGSWTSQPMRMGPMPRMPRQLPVTRKLESIEGFDAYQYESTVRPAPGTTSPRGEYKRVSTAIPALSDFDAVLDLPSGERRTAVNIRLGPQSASAFCKTQAGGRETSKAISWTRYTCRFGEPVRLPGSAKASPLPSPGSGWRNSRLLPRPGAQRMAH
jgi:hypothetical protein